MKVQIKTSIMMATLFLSFNTFAAPSHKSLECSTPRVSKAFKIFADKVTFMHENDKGRTIASLRTKKTFKGFTKNLNYEGNKIKIHIEDTNSLSDVNDYMTIRSREGHEMIYPLTCSKS